METKIVYHTKNNHIVLVPLIDLHFGSQLCNENIFNKGISMIRSRSDCFSFLGGDIIEAAIYGSVGSVHSQKHQLDEQVEKIVKMLKPISKKILFAIDGNHEHRVEKSTGLNITKIIADMLGIPYMGWETFFVIKLKNQICKLYAHHGTGASMTSGAKLNALERLHFRAPLSNVIICGHLHFPMNSEKEIRYVDNQGNVRKYNQVYIGCGSIHESDGYASMKALTPIEASLTTIKIHNGEHDFVVETKKIKS